MLRLFGLQGSQTTSRPLHGFYSGTDSIPRPTFITSTYPTTPRAQGMGMTSRMPCTSSSSAHSSIGHVKRLASSPTSIWRPPPTSITNLWECTMLAGIDENIWSNVLLTALWKIWVLRNVQAFDKLDQHSSITLCLIIDDLTL